jgi:hypothetical protein
MLNYLLYRALFHLVTGIEKHVTTRQRGRIEHSGLGYLPLPRIGKA